MSESRERILRAAASLFAAHGYENTNILAIARGAATSESQILRNFENKEGLMAATLDRGWRRLVAIVHDAGGALPARQRARDVLVQVLRELDSERECARLLLLESGRVRRKSDGNVLAPPAMAEFHEAVDSILRGLQRARYLRSDVRVPVIRTVVLGFVGEALRNAYFSTTAPWMVISRAELLAAFDDVLGTFAAPKRRRARAVSGAA